MNILFVRTYCPNRIVYGSEMRAGLYVDYFRRKGNVDLLTLTAPGQDANRAYIQSNFRQHFYFDQRGKHRRMGSFEKLACLAPWQVTVHYAREFQEKLNTILEDNSYDLIFVFKLEPAFYFLRVGTCWQERVVLDFDDILSDVYRGSYKNSWALKLYEDKALKEFRRVFVCSHHAFARIPLSYRKKVGIVPNVFAADREQCMTEPGPANRLLFVGSLDYFPNLEGLKWFCAEVWPELLKAYPDLALSIIGKMRQEPSEILSFLGDPKNTEVTANVPSVVPFYKNCCATIVPLLNASGTRLKILESVSYGRPVISTPKGVEGLDFEHGKDIFIFKDAGSCIHAYKTLFNKEKYRQTVQNARDVLRKQYSPQVFISSMDENWPMMSPRAMPTAKGLRTDLVNT